MLWNERTTDGYANMRAKIDAELQDLKDEFDSGGLTWCERDVKRLIDLHPKHEKHDRVLENLREMIPLAATRTQTMNANKNQHERRRGRWLASCSGKRSHGATRRPRSCAR